MSSKATPPHHPTYNVRLNNSQIQAIVSLIFTGQRLLKIEQLQSGKSFNNRIYFLEVTSGSKSDVKSEEYVIKVAGQFFGTRKIQNEIGCLQLLAKHCPNVPTPRAVAWSEDGSQIKTSDGRSIDLSTQREANPQDHETSAAASTHAWVLTNRLPGRLLNQKDLDSDSGVRIMKSLASILFEWRTKMPQIPHYGNLRYRESSDTPNTTTVFESGSPEFSIGGLILCGQYSSEPLHSSAEYYTYQAKDWLRELEKSKRFLGPLAEKIENPVRSFVTEQLPKLPMFQNREEVAKFTHFDFAPRNILVSDEDPSQILGILDCEFAGFAPWEEEFINMQIRQSDDWSEKHYKVMLQELARLGQTAPPFPGKPPPEANLSSDNFAQLCVLARLIENISPWYLAEGSMPQEELDKEIDRASEAVLDSIKQLQATL